MTVGASPVRIGPSAWLCCGWEWGWARTAPHVDPQIENAHDQQDERGWKDLRGHQYLPGQPRRGQVQIVDETKENCPRNISGQHEPRGIHQESEPPDQSALGP